MKAAPSYQTASCGAHLRTSSYLGISNCSSLPKPAIPHAAHKTWTPATAQHGPRADCQYRSATPRDSGVERAPATGACSFEKAPT
eukprot:4703564-Pleurochrysis_carterae.AAC.4